MRVTAIVTLAVVALGVLAGYIWVKYPPYREVVLERGDLSLVVSAIGKVEPVKEVDLAPKTLGRIKDILVNEGDYVEEGQLIAYMENDEIKAQVEQAKANLLRAQAELVEAKQNWYRLSAISEKEIISWSQLDNAKMKKDVAISNERKARADLMYAQALLENTFIKAPFSGKIIRKYLNPGETITLEKLLPIVTLADVSKLIVKAEVVESDIRKVKLGQRAIITADAYPGEEFPGKVTDISTSIGKKKILSDDPSEMVDTDVLETKIELEGKQKLNLGLQVEATIIVDSRKDVLVLPLEAIDKSTGVVKVKKEGGFEERKVVTGLSDGFKVEIVDGLKEGEVVLIPNRRTI
jgi:RND family efflux transporter MFP subunit